MISWSSRHDPASQSAGKTFCAFELSNNVFTKAHVVCLIDRASSVTKRMIDDAHFAPQQPIAFQQWLVTHARAQSGPANCAWHQRGSIR
jgi:hypothetical protein